MRALVTGAAGFVGRLLCEALVARGDEVTALYRTRPAGPDSRQATAFGVREASSPGVSGAGRPEGVRVIAGDVRDAGVLREAVAGQDVVYHLAGIRRASVRAEFFAVNAGGTERLCEVAAALETPPRVVLAGSLAASGPAREGRPLTEADPLRPADWYGESKAEAERILAGFSGRVPWSVARPSRILGAGDRENLAFFKVAARGLRLEITGPPRPISLIDVDDVIRGLVTLAGHPAALGQAFFLSAEAWTLGEIMEAGADALGLRLRPVRIPPAVLKVAGAGADLVSRVTGKRLPLNRKLARQLTAPGWMCSTDKARERLGFSPLTPVARSIEVSARWYVEQGLL